MYHHVSPLGGELTVTPENFEDHLRMLRRKGWGTLSGEEFLSCIQQKRVPERRVLLTFDDGFADNYVFAYPILRKCGMKAVLFVTTSLIGDDAISRAGFSPLPHREAWRKASESRKNDVMCTWNELREMEHDGTFDIQAHGMTHTTHVLFGEKKYDQLEDDLSSGKKMLEKHMSKEVHHLAWPKGIYDERGIDIAVRIGFKALYTTERGANCGMNLTAIKRVPVKNRGGEWLYPKLRIYSSKLLSSLYLAVRSGR